MKILNIITGGLNSDGITNAWLTFMKELTSEQKYHDITIDFATIDAISSNHTIQLFDKIGIKTPILPNRNRHPVRYFIKLFSLLKKENYDIIHVNGSSSLMLIELLAGVCAGIPLRIAHSRNTTCSFLTLHKLLKYPFNLVCNMRLACGEDAGKWLFGKKKFYILRNGKDLNRFKFNKIIRTTKRAELQLEDKIAIGHVGKFNVQKNHKFLIEVFNEFHLKNSNSHLFLFGDGVLLNEIKETVNTIGLNDSVTFVGSVDNIEDWLHAMDVMVFPSLFEGLPNVVIEWQANGLPSIISDTITTECVQTDLVVLKNINDTPLEWSHSINNLIKLSNREIHSKYALESLKGAKFDIKDTVDTLISIYKEHLNIDDAL